MGLTDSDFDEKNPDYLFQPLPIVGAKRKPIVGAGVNVSAFRARLKAQSNIAPKTGPRAEAKPERR